MVSTVEPTAQGMLSDCWTLLCPGSPLGLVTHFGTNESAQSLCTNLAAQGLAPNGGTIQPATLKDLA